MMFFLAFESTLIGMKVWKAFLAMFESVCNQLFVLRRMELKARTAFTQREAMIDWPGHHTTRHAAPAPFENTAQNL